MATPNARQRWGRKRRITLGADKAYDAKDFVDAARQLNVTLHVAKNGNKRRSNLDRRTTRHAGYSISRAAAGWSRKASDG
jgi:hypothetical protein